MDYKEIFQILVEHRDVSYATSIFAAMAVGILVWLISTRVYRRENGIVTLSVLTSIGSSV